MSQQFLMKNRNVKLMHNSRAAPIFCCSYEHKHISYIYRPQFSTSKLLFSPKFEATFFEVARKLSLKDKRHFNELYLCQNHVLLEYLAYYCICSTNHLKRVSNHLNVNIACPQRIFCTIGNGNVQLGCIKSGKSLSSSAFTSLCVWEHNVHLLCDYMG